jgi:HPt (histidine-containing phosphotransfer) domain-containing protein
MSDIDLNQLPLLDEDIIIELREIMEDEFTDLLNTFLHDLPVQLAHMEAAVAQGDSNELYSAAHKLKSSCGSLGALRLAEVVRRLEQAGRDGTVADAVALLPLARDFTATTMARLQQHIE